MGALDDAIKEHLELKRRHGASEDELRKQEAEALGPGRREPVPEPEDEELAGPFGEAAEDIELPLGEPPLEDEPAEEIDPVEELAPLEERAPVEEVEPLEEPEPEPRAPDPVEEPEPDEVPREESLEAPRRAQAGGAEPDPDDEPQDAEDVLEETPEFLQETPEHDRLWFEQKPPRDFDFDE